MRDKKYYIEGTMQIGLTVVIKGKDFEITSVDDLKMIEVNHDINQDVKVKYLDKEDIESFGFVGQEANSVYFTKGNYRIVHWFTNQGRDISIFEKYVGGEDCLLRKAIVKNKSELATLLKQLQIDDV